MLYDKAGNQVFVPKNKEMSDHMKRTHDEKLEPLPHKGDKIFRMEERAHLK